MSNWNYAREETVRVGAGDHRFEVVSAEEKVSTAGNDMIVLMIKPNGAQFTVRENFVAGEYFNRKVTAFFDSTGIEDGNFELATWVGAVGAARFKEGKDGYLEVAYFLNKRQQEKLPAWIGDMPERQTVTQIGGGDGDGFAPDDEESPF